MPAEASSIFASSIDLALARHVDWQPDPVEGYCPRCGETLGPHEGHAKGCRRCEGQRFPWECVVRLGAYKPPLADWIVAMKFARAWYWGAWMGKQLAASVQARETAEQVAVCPVPLAWSRRLRRGYNQAALVGTALADQCKWPVAPVLRRRRRTPPQTTVSRSQRTANAGLAFAACPVDLAGWTVWLVDDVKTTGATLRACARRLRAAGAQRVCVAVVAVTDA